MSESSKNRKIQDLNADIALLEAALKSSQNSNQVLREKIVDLENRLVSVLEYLNNPEMSIEPETLKIMELSGYKPSEKISTNEMYECWRAANAIRGHTQAISTLRRTALSLGINVNDYDALGHTNRMATALERAVLEMRNILRVTLPYVVCQFTHKEGEVCYRDKLAEYILHLYPGDVILNEHKPPKEVDKDALCFDHNQGYPNPDGTPRQDDEDDIPF